AKDLPPQVGVLVATDAAGAEVAKDVAMHIAAYSPTFLSRDDVPAEQVADERRIAEETARNEGKPEGALPKIIEGRLNGSFAVNVPLDRAVAKDPEQTVGQVVAEAGGTVSGDAGFRAGASPARPHADAPSQILGGGRRIIPRLAPRRKGGPVTRRALLK